MANFDNYIDRLKEYAEELKKASVWSSSRLPVSNSNTNADRKFDFIYEFFCYMTILRDLSDKYSIEYYPGQGNFVNAFPKAPADKLNRPRFNIYSKLDSSKGYQVCAGTFVKDKRNNKRAPDISFQKLDSDNTLPSNSEVKFIFDAKRKRNLLKNGIVSDGQYSSFVRLVSNMNLQLPSKDRLHFSLLQGFSGNCIITNGEAFCNDKKENKEYNVVEVENFSIDYETSAFRVI